MSQKQPTAATTATKPMKPALTKASSKGMPGAFSRSNITVRLPPQETTVPMSKKATAPNDSPSNKAIEMGEAPSNKVSPPNAASPKNVENELTLTEGLKRIRDLLDEMNPQGKNVILKNEALDVLNKLFDLAGPTRGPTHD